MKTKKCKTCELRKSLLDNFYWNSVKVAYENQCKSCRLKKMKKKQRTDYDSIKERKRYLKRKENGEFVGNWQKWKAKFPEKYKARYQLRNAVKSGKIKKDMCVIGKDCNGRLEAHHEDYNKPLEVMWFCQKHHKLHHYPNDLASLQDKLTGKNI